MALQLEMVPAKTIVTKNASRDWFGADYTMNLYRGCCHGCIYCDSRSDCYHIDRFDRVRVKENALALVRDGLRSKGRTGVVATGSMSDPYNPFEQELLYTRHALELVSAFGFGAAVATKSPLIARDTDVLLEIKAQAPVICMLTVTTCSTALARKLEPGAPPPMERLKAVEHLARAGIFAGVLLMPVLPFLEDSEENVREVVYCAAQAGARFVYPMLGMTLRAGQREYFYKKLEEAFPGEGLPARYDRRYGPRYQCFVPGVHKLSEAFRQEVRRHSMLCDMRDIVAGYQQGYGSGQLSFL